MAELPKCQMCKKKRKIAIGEINKNVIYACPDCDKAKANYGKS